MQEEIIALIPMLLLLTRRLGFDAVTAVAMSLGAAMVRQAFRPVNPFHVGNPGSRVRCPPSMPLGLQPRGVT